MRKLLFTAAFSVLSSVSAALAADVVLPDPFSTRDIPKHAPDGKKIKGIALPTSLVVRRPNGELFALYGYIMARGPSAISYTYFNNAKLGLTCWTIIDPKTQPDPSGVNRCYQDGQIIEEMAISVPRKDYGKFKGTVVQQTNHASGVYTSAMRWKAGSKFPDIQPLLDAFK